MSESGFGGAGERGPDAGESLGREAERLRERVEEARQRLGGLFPPEFQQHVRAARREFWLALRSLIDARLEAIEDEARPKPRSGRIDVD